VSDEVRCPICEEGEISPRTGPRRFWKHLGHAYELPESLPVTQCGVCGAFAPTAAELGPLTEWLTDKREEPRPKGLAARHFGTSPRENHALTSFVLPWVPRRTIVTSDLHKTVGRRSVEHLIRGGRREMLTTMDHHDVRRLGIHVDEGSGLVRWLFVPVSKYSWRALLDGLSSVGVLVDEHDGEVEIVDYNRHGQPVSMQSYPPAELPAGLQFDDLAEEARLDLRQTIVDVPHERAIMFDGKPVHGHSIGAFSLLHAYQGVMRVVETTRSVKGDQPLLTAVAGSFGLRVDGPGAEGFDQAWETLEFLLDRAANPETLADAFRRDPAAESVMASFLEGMRRSGLELYLKTPHRRLHVTPVRAKRAKGTLDEARRLLMQEHRLVEGFFMGFNASPNGSFAFMDDATREPISGRIDSVLRTSYLAGAITIVLSTSARYRIRVQPMGTDMRHDYLLRDVRLISTGDAPPAPAQAAVPEAEADDLSDE